MSGQATIAATREVLERARHPNRSVPKPFLRWAGSKRYLMKYLVDVLPHKHGTYFEPFLGSGSLLFMLLPPKSKVSDSNVQLIDTYSAVRDNIDRVGRLLQKMPVDKVFYYHMRRLVFKGRFQRAAQFIYLNRHCWNGLYRVNGQGKFNVPYGNPKIRNTVDLRNLRACSDYLRRHAVDIQACDFEETVEDARRGDLVYFDPPYLAGPAGNGFIEYNEQIFSWADQKRLARIARKLVARGVSVIVSNSAHPEVAALYSRFEQKRIERSSTLAADTDFRGIVTEAVFFRVFAF